MKKSLIISCLIFVFSCSKLTIDEKTQNNLKPVWSQYFQEDFDDTTTVEIIVATNRKAKVKNFGCSDGHFGTTIDLVRFGSCKISIPKNHAVGEIPFTKDNRQSAQNYFKMLDSGSLTPEEIVKKIKDSNRTPLVFVHGFNVKFEEAVLRASQIAYDLKYQGPIILFTWPAGAGEGVIEQNLLNQTYEKNSETAKFSIRNFKEFLLTLQQNNIKLNLMVHSMGHQVVLPALNELSKNNSITKPFIQQLILNAPDFAVNEFKNIAKDIKKVSDNTTLYCSYNDKAMTASKTFNANDRLGACTLFDNIDVINVSAIDDPTLGLGHGYYSSRAVLNDISQTLWGISANRRSFIVKSEPNGAEKYLLRK